MNGLGRPALASVVVCALTSIASPARADTTNACSTTCEGALSPEEARKVATVVDPTLQTMRSCLAGVGGGDAIRPTVLVIIDGAGAVRNIRIMQVGAGGHENLACMPRAASVASVEGATEMMRCELRCEAPAASAPLSPPETSDKDWPALPRAPKREAKLWYGWQTLIADGSALALMIAAIPTDSGAVAGFGLLTYLFAPPIVHLAHSRVGPAFGSLGMRLVAPIGGMLIGGIIGAVIDPNKGGGDPVGSTGLGVGLIGGFVVGYGAAVAIDAGLLGYETVEVKEKPHALRVLPSLVLAPTPHGFVGTGGLQGTF